jgi:hypothetical protein
MSSVAFVPEWLMLVMSLGLLRMRVTSFEPLADPLKLVEVERDEAAAPTSDSSELPLLDEEEEEEGDDVVEPLDLG